MLDLIRVEEESLVSCSDAGVGAAPPATAGPRPAGVNAKAQVGVVCASRKSHCIWKITGKTIHQITLPCEAHRPCVREIPGGPIRIVNVGPIGDVVSSVEEDIGSGSLGEQLKGGISGGAAGNHHVVAIARRLNGRECRGAIIRFAVTHRPAAVCDVCQRNVDLRSNGRIPRSRLTHSVGASKSRTTHIAAGSTVQVVRQCVDASSWTAA